MTLLQRPLPVLLLVVLSLVAVAVLTAAEAQAATRTCKVTRSLYPGQGYVTSLTVNGATCTTAKKLVVAFYRCRVRNGGRKGRCPATTKLLGYSCKENKRVSIATEINARVTCRRGARTVVHTYQQNLD